MFGDDNKILIASTTTLGAAGTSVITSSAIDTIGFNECTFIVPLGTIVAGAVTSLKVQQSSDDAATDDYTDLTGSNQTIADTDDDKLKYVSIGRPQKRYLKLVFSRGTQSATIGGIIAILSSPRTRPVAAQGSNVAGEQFMSDVEGTA
jgi:hypothetical protein